MFGYVRPKISELKVKEYELYKSIYCGLCKCMGERVCRASEMTLSYDMVFLALIRIALENDAVSASKRRCAVHPIKKVTLLDACGSLEYSARAGALLAYYNILDNVRDKSGIGKAGSVALLPYAKRLKKKAELCELEGAIKSRLKALCELEEKETGTLDEAADIFGGLLGDVFSFGIKDEAGYRIAYEIGSHTGRWIYMIDAIDDYEEDVKTHSYNPIIYSGECGKAAEKLSAEQKQSLRCALMLELERLCMAVELIDFNDDGIKNIIYNIVYAGMTERSDNVLNGNSAHGHKSAAHDTEKDKDDSLIPD